MSKTMKLRVKLTSLLKRIFSVYFSRYFIDSKYSSFQKIKTRKFRRKFFIFRNVIKYQKGTRCL